MPTYTAIALLSLLSITLSANAARAVETLLLKLETATAEYMLSAQTKHKPERLPERGKGRRECTQPNIYTDQLQAF